MKLYINQNFGGFTTDVFMEMIEGDQRSFIEYGKDHLLIRHTKDVNECSLEEPKYFMRLPDHMFQEFLELMVEYANEKGIKTENENLLKGKLDATERHLVDLQKVLDKHLKAK